MSILYSVSQYTPMSHKNIQIETRSIHKRSKLSYNYMVRYITGPFTTVRSHYLHDHKAT